MGTISRGTKAAGGTDFVDNTDALASEVNTDFNTIYSEFNGSINNSNVANGADVDVEKVGDYSASASESATATDPGVSDSESLATDLADELERLRYAVERLSLGVDAVRNNAGGATNTYWGDLPARGHNLILNGQFNVFDAGSSSAPDGWTLNGAATVTAIHGSGAIVGVTTPASDYMSYTISDLNGGTRILVVVNMAVSAGAGNATLTTSGADATSDFRDIVLTETVTGIPTSTVRYGVIQAGASDIELRFGGTVGGGGATYTISQIAAYVIPESGSFHFNSGPIVYQESDTTTTSVGAAFATDTDLEVSNVHPPRYGSAPATGDFANGWTAIVRCNLTFVATSAEDVVAKLAYDTGGGDIDLNAVGGASIPAGDAQTISLVAKLANLDGDLTYTFKPLFLGATGGNATINGTFAGETMQSNMVVELVPPGS